MSLWVKVLQIRTSCIVNTGAIFQKGFGFYLEVPGKIQAGVTLDNIRYGAKTKSLLAVGIWYHVTCIYEKTSRISIYFDGILEKGFDEEGVWAEKNVTEEDWDTHIGVRDSEPYKDFPLDGYVDEFKYYYRTLSSLGKYSGYSLKMRTVNRALHAVLFSLALKTLVKHHQKSKTGVYQWPHKMDLCSPNI